MINQTEFVPAIMPVGNGGQRPLWSVMIPTYNCALYLKQTLATVLAQDLGPEFMQIEVVDDCSTQDDPAAVVKKVGNGRVNFFKQPANVGAISTFNTCIQRSVGQFIHILHGDDLVADGFYRRLEHPLLDNPTIGAAFCRQIYIDHQNQPILTTRLEQPTSGILPNALDILAVSNRIPPPAMVVRRTVYERLGGYDMRLFHAADWEMWVRIAAAYPIWYEVESLALYRVHPGSDTSKLFRTGANMQNRREAIKIFHAYLPPKRANNLTRWALGYSALYGLRMAFKCIMTSPRVSLTQFREALVCAWQMTQR
jgi:glycosyltransferase involved in cell wall biosynthesis